MLTSGSRVGPYEVVGPLGAGGMGEVYKARDARLGREVALKVVGDSVLADAKSIARFQQEARLAGSLNHPNVLAVHDVGEHEGKPYLVTELLEGEVLRQILAAGPLPQARAVAIGVQIAQGLAAAHEKGIVHRDLKPENVFVTRDGRVKILDFGIAKLLPALRDRTVPEGLSAPQTTAGTPIGTVAYMSPEQVRGNEVDARSDLFSLGCVLYEMLAGRRPFEGRTAMETGAAILQEKPAPLPADVPRELASLVFRCLRKDPGQRVHSAKELVSALSESPQAASQAAAAKPAGLVDELKRRRVFRALVAYGIAAFAVLQIVEPVMHGLHWPEAVLSYVVVALAIGFPVVVGLAWAFDLHAGRLERTAEVPGGPGRARLMVAVAGIGVLAAAPGLVWYFFARPGASRNADEVAVRAKLDAIPPASEIRSVPSIAVLPLENLSHDADQEYFSDGLTEDIINALSRVEGLRVAARVSAFSFKNKNEDRRTIGRKLGVATVLEGSVRKQGDRVRINAQLVDVAGGMYLWSQNFDRKLTDIFAVQAEIATAVVEGLKVKLVAGKALTNDRRTSNLAAYDRYLAGLEEVAQYHPERMPAARRYFEAAVALDPGFGRAWSGLSWALALQSDFEPSRAEQRLLQQQAMNAADHAVQLAPEIAETWARRGLMRMQMKWDWAGARHDIDQALFLNPRDVVSIEAWAQLYAVLGETPRAIAAGLKNTELDPYNPAVWLRLFYYHFGSGQMADARRALERAEAVAPEFVRALNARAFWAVLNGQGVDAVALAGPEHVEMVDDDRLIALALGHFSLGHAKESRDALDQLIARFKEFDAYQIAQIYSLYGEKDHALDWLERAFQQHDGGLVAVLPTNCSIKCDPLLRPLRSEPRFLAVLKKMNLPLE
jgi:TolB-like protein